MTDLPADQPPAFLSVGTGSDARRIADGDAQDVARRGGQKIFT